MTARHPTRLPHIESRGRGEWFLRAPFMRQIKTVRASSGRNKKPSHKSPIDIARPAEVEWEKVAPVFQLTQYANDLRFVYFIGEANGPVKIGVAKDPVKRVRELQTGNPRPLRVERVIVGHTDTERLLHKMWEPYSLVAVRNGGRIGTEPGSEWFEATIRGELYPILDTAIQQQIEKVPERMGDGEIHSGYLNDLLWEAHIEHDFVIRDRATHGLREVS